MSNIEAKEIKKLNVNINANDKGNSNYIYPESVTFLLNGTWVQYNKTICNQTKIFSSYVNGTYQTVDIPSTYTNDYLQFGCTPLVDFDKGLYLNFEGFVKGYYEGSSTLNISYLFNESNIDLDKSYLSFRTVRKYTTLLFDRHTVNHFKVPMRTVLNTTEWVEHHKYAAGPYYDHIWGDIGTYHYNFEKE